MGFGAQHSAPLYLFQRRRPLDRLPPAERQGLRDGLAATRAMGIRCYLALGALSEVCRRAKAFAGEHSLSPLLPAVTDCERLALSSRLRQGEGDEEDRRRLLAIVGSWGEAGQAPRGDAALEVAQVLEQLGDNEGAGRFYGRALDGTAGEAQALSRAGLARMARLDERLVEANHHLQAIQEPHDDLAPVRLERALLRRAENEPQAALDELIQVMHGLEDTRPEEWWVAAEETARTYVLTERDDEAIQFLSDVAQKDGTWGGDQARMLRLTRVLQWLTVGRRGLPPKW